MIEIPQFKLDAEPLGMDFRKMFDSTFINIEEELKQPPIALSIGTHPYKGNKYPTQYGSYGDFSCIVGASKSKKTFLKSLLIASYLGGNANRYAPTIKGHDVKDKYVIEIDTEQSKYHCQKVFRRVAEIVGTNPDNYKPFSLRGLTVKERLQFIEYIFLESEFKGKIGLASIDGVADLVTHVNDEEQSYAVAQKLLEWSEKSNSHIITVLHRNFASNKPTGHLGSAVLKKAETVVFIDKDDENVLAVPEYTRNIPFDDFKFSIDEDWLPYIVTDEIRVKDYTQPLNKQQEDNVPF
jgi:hypothetical protein